METNDDREDNPTYSNETIINIDENKLASLIKEARRGQHHYFQIVYRL